MDKKLKNHHRYIEKRIKELKGAPNKAEVEATLLYHENMVGNFQHERLIHLLVTLFFAALFFLVFGVSVALQMSDLFAGDGGFYEVFIDWSVRGVGLALFITTLFYIRHYYKLENGCEKLYDLTTELHGLQGK